MTLATEQGFARYLAMGTVRHGWTRVMQGESAEGTAEMRQGYADYLVTGAKSRQPYFLGLLSEAAGRDGKPEAGLSELREAIAVMTTTEERLYKVELYPLKGVLLLKQVAPDASEAEACFHQALDIARHQQAKSFELRAATSLARLWQQQGRRGKAYDLLAPVYDWFTERLDTADLKEAKAFLDELA